MCFIKHFADDTKASNQILSLEDSIRSSIDSICCLTKDWDVTFNCARCGVMHLGKNNPKHKYTINNTVLNETTSEKDLCVYVDPLLIFEDHINVTVKKARQIAGLIMRNITYKSKEVE